MFESVGKLLTDTPAIVSWLVTLAGTALMLSPVGAAWFLATRKFPSRRFLAAGIALGLVGYAFSFWLYLHYFLDPVRKTLLGYPGLALIRWHCFPFQGLPSISSETGQPVAWYVNRDLLAPIFWAGVYGLVGRVIDTVRRKRVPPAGSTSTDSPSI